MPPNHFTLEDYRTHFSVNKHVREAQGHTSKVHTVNWSSDGRYLASGSFDKTVAIYSFDRNDRVAHYRTLKGHTDSVDQLCWHPKNPDMLVSASLDKSVRFWDMRSGRSMGTIPTKGENININWSPDGKTIAVGNKEDLVSFIDFSARTIKEEHQFKFEANELSWNQENDLFLVTSGSGQVHVLSYPGLESQLVLNAHPATCICIDMDPTGEHFAVGAADASVSIWDAAELCCMRTISRLDYPARSISFSHDGRLLASASEDLQIDIAYVDTGDHVASIPTASSSFAVAFHPTRPLLAFACDDKDPEDRQRDAGTINVWGLT